MVDSAAHRYSRRIVEVGARTRVSHIFVYCRHFGLLESSHKAVVEVGVVGSRSHLVVVEVHSFGNWKS